MSPGSPFEQLLQQCLLLPLLLDIVMAAVAMRSARGPANRALAALLAVLCIVTAAILLSEYPWGRMASAEAGVLVGPSLLWFLWIYSGGRRTAWTGRWLAFAILLPAVIFLCAAVAMGWPPSHPAYLLVAVAYYGTTAILFVRFFRAGTIFGREPELIAAATAILFMAGPVYDYAYSGIVPLTLFPYLSALSGGLLTFPVLKYKAFFLRPVAEACLAGEQGLPAGPGVYLARAERSGQARSLLAHAARHGVPSLAITHTHPVAFRRRTGLRVIPVIWLAHSEYEKSLAPGEPDILLHALKDYVGQSGRSVVLLEDLDYLVTNAGLLPTFELMMALIDEAGRSGAVFLVSSELLTPDERRELAELGLKALR